MNSIPSVVLVVIPAQVELMEPDVAVSDTSAGACCLVTSGAALRDHGPGSNSKEEAPPRTPDQPVEIRGHLFHNIAASWFPEAAAFAQKVQADIWAVAKAFLC